MGRTRRPCKSSKAGTEPAPQRQPLPRRRKLLFALGVFVATCGTLEGASRLFVGLAPNARWEYKCHLLETLGFPALSEILVADEHLFWKLRPNLARFRLSGRFANAPPLEFAVSTDAEGLRRVPPATPHPPHRVVCLGDSCTFGVGVEDHEALPAVLQERLPNARFINASVPGYTAYQGRLLLERLRLDQAPRVVLVNFGRNDDLVWDDRSDIEHGQRIAADRRRILRHVRIVELLRGLRARRPAGATSDGPPRPRLNDEEFAAEIRVIIEWCRARRAEPILMLWPHISQMRDEGLSGKQAAMMAVARDEGVRLVNLIPAFRAHGGIRLFGDVIHANAAGCRVAAEAVLPLVQAALEEPEYRTARP